jgi:SAM-dependent methyltransferase
MAVDPDPKRLARFVGCGTGALSQVIFEHAVPNEIKGIDSSADFIAYANAQVGRGRGTFEVGDAQALPIESASFDAVVSGLVLNLCPNRGGQSPKWPAWHDQPAPWRPTSGIMRTK